MKTKILPMTVSLLCIASLFCACEKGAATVDSLIKTENQVLNGFGIKEYKLNIKNSNEFTVEFSSSSIPSAEIKFVADTVEYTRKHYYKDEVDNFEIDFGNNGVLYIFDKRANLHFEIVYDSKIEKFKDRISGKVVEGNDWISTFKINKTKYMIVSVIFNEVLNERKIFTDPVKAKQERESKAVTRARIMTLMSASKDGHLVATEPGGGGVASCDWPLPCNSQVIYNWDRTRCCAEATSNLEYCCNNKYPAYCLGCCTKAECNFGGIFGDFLGICTRSGTACGRKVDHVVDPG